MIVECRHLAKTSGFFFFFAFVLRGSVLLDIDCFYEVGNVLLEF